jgi:hypothetical protein
MTFSCFQSFAQYQQLRCLHMRENMIKHMSCSGVRKSDMVIIKNLNIHWFNYLDDLFLSALCTVLYVLKSALASYQLCFAALICDDVPPPSMNVGPVRGTLGFTTRRDVRSFRRQCLK